MTVVRFAQHIGEASCPSFAGLDVEAFEPTANDVKTFERARGFSVQDRSAATVFTLRAVSLFKLL